jgi:hypothetical protein
LGTVSVCARWILRCTRGRCKAIWRVCPRRLRGRRVCRTGVGTQDLEKRKCLEDETSITSTDNIQEIMRPLTTLARS